MDFSYSVHSEGSMIFITRTRFLSLRFHPQVYRYSERFNDHVDDSSNNLAWKFLDTLPDMSKFPLSVYFNYPLLHSYLERQ